MPTKLVHQDEKKGIIKSVENIEPVENFPSPIPIVSQAVEETKSFEKRNSASCFVEPTPTMAKSEHSRAEKAAMKALEDHGKAKSTDAIAEFLVMKYEAPTFLDFKSSPKYGKSRFYMRPCPKIHRHDIDAATFFSDVVKKLDINEPPYWYWDSWQIFDKCKKKGYWMVQVILNTTHANSRRESAAKVATENFIDILGESFNGSFFVDRGEVFDKAALQEAREISRPTTDFMSASDGGLFKLVPVEDGFRPFFAGGLGGKPKAKSKSGLGRRQPAKLVTYRRERSEPPPDRNLMQGSLSGSQKGKSSKGGLSLPASAGGDTKTPHPPKTD